MTKSYCNNYHSHHATTIATSSCPIAAARLLLTISLNERLCLQFVFAMALRSAARRSRLGFAHPDFRISRFLLAVTELLKV